MRLCEARWVRHLWRKAGLGAAGPAGCIQDEGSSPRAVGVQSPGGRGGTEGHRSEFLWDPLALASW